jgi:DNA polymerase III delta prime subunit
MLAVNQATQARLDILTANLPQAVLLSGVRGVGLYTIARSIAAKQLFAEVRPQNVKEQIDSEHGTISVKMIRELYNQTGTKQSSRQVVIIDDADTMSRGAQAAFLKLLEEPNSHIHFILTTHTPQNLLPTIRSRLQETVVAPTTVEQSMTLLSELGVTEAAKTAQMRYIAMGLPAELTRLAQDSDYFATRAGVMADARTLLQGSPYQKLLIAHKYHNQREQALQLIDSALLMARRSLSDKPQHGLVVQLEKLLTTRATIARSGNIRLQLALFVLQ